ncbi:FkbM family methyltransferase [Flavobacterium cauense R2A-7]|uniref:FkbM family methyltransferase n=1 Tax=Flavobacterium cauense R2A-7 TaxID=1341154 RepID=V6S8T7_9FLAO|nr:FkbM family methyltransferase [Flavobacterium cauense]ESU20805.1 FkbM family methyltransferase [Flavobacterium cauense R2A-7]KGO82830.1 FkbM family methyltransferase [Flavobacterium cauense R2A-7]TWI12146.1 FkbM family methyltransferase [Flavobacterium cauense R2A-7]
MKKKIRKIVHAVLDPIVTRLGYMNKVSLTNQGNEFDKNNLLETFFLNLKAMGFIPKHIVDVGANHGTWTRETLKYFPDAYYTLLEPQKWLQSSLQDILDTNNKVTFHPVGAGSSSGSFKFTIVDRDDSCSFRYTEEEAKDKGYEQIEIPIVTLNELVGKGNLPTPDIVKIDAEGLDVEVLKGADSLFGKTEIFMVEAGVFNKEFDNSFLNMINFMDEKGYRLFEITDLNRPFQPQVLWLVELVFIKKNGIVDSYKINW